MDCTVTPGGLMHAQVHASSALTAQESGHGCFPAGFTCTVSHGHQRAPSAFKQVLAHGGWVGAWDLGWATSTSNSHSMDKVTELQHQRDQQNLALAPQLRP